MSKTNFDRLFALLALAAVVIAVITGFWLLGSPDKQRQLRADRQRLQDIREIAQRLHEQAKRSPTLGKPINLPASLPPPVRQFDPISGKTYEYRRLDSTHYQLCAEFATDSNKDRLRDYPEMNQDFWQHPSGQHCFQLDVLEELPYP